VAGQQALGTTGTVVRGVDLVVEDREFAFEALPADLFQGADAGPAGSDYEESMVPFELHF
jgi:hypothetical protein